MFRCLWVQRRARQRQRRAGQRRARDRVRSANTRAGEGQRRRIPIATRHLLRAICEFTWLVARFTTVAAATALAIAAPAQHVAADDASDVQVEAEYQQLINDALSEYERGSWEESSALFLRAHELRPSARTLRGLGLAAFEARRYADCIRYLSQALDDERRPLTSKQREEVDATLARAKLFVGYLQLSLSPETASVSINGQELRVAGPELIVDVGWLDVEARAEGYETLNKRLRVSAGDHRALQLHLSSTTQPMAAATPLALPEHVAPPRLVEPSTPVTTPRDAASTTASPFKTWKWVSSAAAVAALGVGATFLILQKTQAPDYTAECVNTTLPKADCERRKSLLGGTFWTGSIVGLSAGAGLAALSVVLFALDAKAANSQHDDRPSAWACHGEGELGAACRFQF